jgi:hypothetical protein
MKKFCFLLLAAVITCAATAQKVNDKVSVEHADAWYDAQILKADAANGQFYIKYDGWDDAWNEWVTPDRIKGGTHDTPPAPLTKFKVGDKVEVEYGMIPEPATVLEVGENKYHIKYDNSLFGEKWVTEKQVKKL